MNRQTCLTSNSPTDGFAAVVEMSGGTGRGKAAAQRVTRPRRCGSTKAMLVAALVVGMAGGLGVAEALLWRAAWRYAELRAAASCMQQFDYREAAERLESLHRFIGPTAESLFQQGRALRRLGELSAAGQCFQAALTLGWDESEIHVQSLLARAQAGDVKEVEKKLLGLMRMRPSDELAEEFYEAIAQGFASSMRPTDAEECIRYWKEWQPESPLPWYWEGVALEGQEAFSDALASYSTAAGLCPTHLPARLGQARMELETARPDDAEIHFADCVDDFPQNAEAALGFGRCLVNRGAREEAADVLRKALTLELASHQAALVLAELGQLHLEEGEVEAAVAVLQQAVAMDPIHPRMRLILATALARSGAEQAANDERETGRVLSEKQVEMTNIGRRIRVNPEDANLRADAADVFASLGMNREAARWYETALQIEPGHERSRRGLLVIAREQGDAAAEREHSRFLRDPPHDAQGSSDVAGDAAE